MQNYIDTHEQSQTINAPSTKAAYQCQNPTPTPGRKPPTLDWSPGHLKSLPFKTRCGLEESLFERVNQAIHDKSMRLLDYYEIASAIASSGASMFDLYDVEFDADDVTITEEGIWVDFTFNINGEPDDDCRPCTDCFSGKATVAIDLQGHVSFQDVTLD